MKEKFGYNVGRIAVGCGVGLANSLFGGGGGMIAVPMLQKQGLEEKRAHATAILLILPISLFSFLFYAVKKTYSLSVLLPTAIGVTLGGFVGAKLLTRLNENAVRKTFALLQLLAGLFLLFGRGR